ncbi:ATP-dependent DNA helicase DinG [Cytobacillus suaedae]|nr:ATP-dependent DNA helicase DinG [Cytobacillus suaedae]
MNQRYVVVDLETTGNSPKKGDKIIQFAAVVIEDGEIIERFASFINPGREIPPFIEQFTGISNEVVHNAPNFQLIAPEIESLLEGAYFVAHNVPFDLTFLQEELINSGCKPFEGPTLDTVELARIMIPSTDSYKLGQLAENFSLAHDNPHQADSDAEVTAEILLKILVKLRELPLVTCTRLLQYAPLLKSDLHKILSQIIEEKEKLSHRDSESYDVYRGIALKKKDKIILDRSICEVNYDSIKKDLFSNEGHLSNHIQQYEEREGQLIMMDTIMQAFLEQKHSIVEAGTGIGKTFAYLLPAILFAKQTGRTIIISTKTIQLQQQLIDHEIPILLNTIPFPFQATVLKGRGHYLCLRRFEQVLYEQESNYDMILAKAQILVWLTETETGDVDELNLPSGGKLLWNRIKSEKNSNLGKECPWRSRCFYRRAKRQAQQSEIIITNHSLLFADLLSEGDILPGYEEVIIDEAHHLESIASSHLGVKLDYLEVTNLFSRLGSSDSKDLVGNVIKIFRGIGLDIDGTFPLIESLNKDIKQQLDDLFTEIRTFALEHHKQVQTSINRVNIPLDESVQKDQSWGKIVELMLHLSTKMDALCTVVNNQYDSFKSLQKLVTPMQKGTIYDYFSVVESIKSINEKLTLLLLVNQNNMVSWVEADTKGAKNAAYLFSQPINISEELKATFFSRKKSVILTSATLSIKGSFEFMIERLGLSDYKPNTVTIPSPFNYKEQAAVLIPNDLPEINEVSEDEYVHAISIHIAEIALKTNGRMLILFTSYDMLKKTHSTLKELAFLDDFVIIGQGVSSGSRSKLTKNFQAFEKSILLGTNSFWEGVDIPGEDLTALVIVRLPFSPPNDPIYATHAKRIKESGGNPFKQLALPEAILRFKQGFGRLVRSKQDHGVVFIFDRRITTTSYGNQFIKALPEVSVIENSLSNLLETIDKWI